MAYDATIRREDLRAVLDLRGGAEVPAALRSVGLPAPARPNTAARSPDTTVAWVGEDHWLILAPLEREQALSANLPTALVVSDAYASFDIAGPQAGEVVAQASSLDVHPRAFPPDGASFTDFFGQRGLLIRREGGFECLVDASYADYIADCLSRCHARMA